MTYREFLNVVMNIVMNESENEEVKEYAKGAIVKLDAELEKRKNTPSKKALENAPLVDQIVNEILTDSPMTASEICAILGCTVQRASMLCRKAVEEGRAVSTDVKVPKKGTVKGYTKA